MHGIDKKQKILIQILFQVKRELGSVRVRGKKYRLA